MSQNNYLSKREVYKKMVGLSESALYIGLKITTSQRERFIFLHTGMKILDEESLKITTSQRERFIAIK